MSLINSLDPGNSTGENTSAYQLGRRPTASSNVTFSPCPPSSLSPHNADGGVTPKRQSYGAGGVSEAQFLGRLSQLSRSEASSGFAEQSHATVSARGSTMTVGDQDGNPATNLHPAPVVVFPPGVEGFFERLLLNEQFVMESASNAIDDEFEHEAIKSRRLQQLYGQSARRSKYASIEQKNENELKALLDNLGDAIRDRETTLKADGYQAFLFSNEYLYEGDWKNSRMHGRGVMRSRDGEHIYEGEWFLGMRNGQGTLHSLPINTTYEGKWSDGKKHGKGELVEPEGVYRGEFRAGIIQGAGEYVYKDGHVYRGEWQRELYHGNGVYMYPTGTRYDGNWREGLENGRGTKVYRNGDVYSGDWLAGRRHGNGAYSSANFQYDGQWRYDHIEGKGTCKYTDGSVYVGQWSKGRFHGNGKLIDGKGRSYTGAFHHGKRHGEGTYEGEGVAYTGPWKSDMKDGVEGSMAFIAGGIYTGSWANDLPHGKGVFETATGVRDRVKYERGVCIERDDSDQFKKFNAELEINMILSPEAERKSRFAAKKRKEAQEQEKIQMLQTQGDKRAIGSITGNGGNYQSETSPSSPQNQPALTFGSKYSGRSSFV